MFNRLRLPFYAKAMLALIISTLYLNGPPMIAKTKIAIATGPSMPMMTERTVDGTQFLQDMADAAAAMKSYSFEYDTTVYKGNKTILQRGQFYFKQPRLLRNEMTGPFKHGSVAVLGKEGKVRGHMGGLLSGVTVSLDPYSDQLLGANGYPFADSDFASIARVMKGFLKQGCVSRVSEHPVTVEGQPKKVYVFEFYRGPGNSELYKRTYIDPQTLLPVEWFDYKGGAMFARTIWKNVKLGPVADDLFQL